MSKSPQHIETEVKLYTPDHAPLRARLHALGAVLVKPRTLERNARYDDRNNQLMYEGVVLRLRQDDNVRLTYKDGGSSINGIVTRQEFEVTVSDFDTMHHILEHLGYTVFMTYEKYRTTYMLEGAEVVLDELPYGNFTEIEGDIPTIERVMDLLGLADAPRMPQSYARIFRTVKENMGLTFDNLTFANFENIDVPLSAFFEKTS